MPLIDGCVGFSAPRLKYDTERSDGIYIGKSFMDAIGGARRIVLDSILRSSERIWGGSAYRDIKEEAILTKDGIVVESKVMEYESSRNPRAGMLQEKQ